MNDQNARFLIYLKKLGEKPAGFRVAHLHVSELPAAKKTRDNLSKAIGILSDLKSKFKDGEIFLMKNLDLVFITKEISKPLLAAACDSIQHAFIGQLSVTFTNVHGGEREFYTLFDLSYEYAKVLGWAEAVAGVAEVAAPSGGDGGPPQAKEAADLALLARIKEEIHRIDIAPMLFNQPVYNIAAGAKAQVLWHEMYMSVQVLENMFCPGMSLTSRKWLFNDLTEDLDTVVLRLLATPEERATRRRMSINVNLSTLASPRFIDFDAQLPAERRNGVVLEVNKTDIFENQRQFHELVPFLRHRGYRILIDGLSFLNIGAIDFDGIPCDFVKVFWSAQAGNLNDELSERVLAKMRNRKSPLIVLARCDSAESIRFAKEMGIKMVQGRLVDHMVKKNIPF